MSHQELRMTPAERSAQASMAAHASWARTSDRTARVAPANAGLEARIAREFEIPDDLPAADYAKRIESARKAYFRQLARRSAQSRARKRNRLMT